MFQSGLKALHSTETALLRVSSDIFTETDYGKSMALVLLDLFCIWIGQPWGPVDTFGDISGTSWHGTTVVPILFD